MIIMLVQISLLAGLASAAAGIDTSLSSDWCGTNVHISRDEHINQLAIQKSISADSTFRLAEVDEVKVNVYVHVVANNTAEGQLRMNDTVIQKQMDRLNEDHKKSLTGFSFHLKGVHRYEDPEWAGHGPYEPGKFPPGTRKGGKADLNIYYQTHLSEAGWNGVTVMPWASNRTDFEDDIVQVSTGTAPGGIDAPLNNGDVTTHEVGHWLGLFHTFENGCEGGDYVDDTPPQKEPSINCPIGKDSCDYPGLDPIHNYMDYSTCQTEFTPGQAERMHFMWQKYRA